MQRRSFTEQEARAKVGKKVRALVNIDAAPAGTLGKVVAVMPLGGAFDLGIQWARLSGPIGRPARSWVTRDEYERFLEEV